MIFKPELSSIVIIMNLAGLRNDKSDKLIIRYLIMLRRIMELIITIITIISCYMSGLKNSMGLVLFYSVFGSITNFQSIYYLFKYETGQQILQDLKTLMKIQESDRTPAMLNNTTRLTWKWVQIFTFNVIGFMVCYMTLPLVVEIILFILQIKVDPFLPPLPLNGFIIGLERHSALYLLVCISSIYWSASGILGVVGNQSIMYIYLAYLSLGVTVFSEKIKKLKKKINLRSAHFKDTVDEKFAAKEYILLIEEHNLLLRLSLNVNSYCGFPFTLQNITLSGCVCLLMYAIVMSMNKFSQLPRTLYKYPFSQAILKECQTKMMFKEDLSSVMTIMRLAGMRNDNIDPLILRYLIMFRHLMETLGTVGSIISCYVAGLKNSLGVVMFFSVIGTITNIQSIYTFFYYETGLTVLCSLQELMDKQEPYRPARMVHDVTNFTWKWVQTYAFNMISFMIFYLCLPVTVDFFFFTLEIEMTPFLPGKAFDGFIYITERRSPEYFSLCLGSIIWTVSSTFSSMGHQILILIFSVYQMVGITALLEKIKNLGRTINDRSVGEKDTADIKVGEKELIEIIQEHNQLLRIGENINVYFGFPFAMQNILASGCVCLLMYANVMEINTDINAMLVNAFCLVIMFLVAGVPCILGQRVETLSDQLRDVLYDLPWYKQSPRLRNYLNMALRQANRGMKIHYHDRSPLNHHTLLNILNTSYSYFMVLQSSL